MRKADDSTLTAQQYLQVRKEAERALRKANVWGCIPTPIDEILRAARVQVSDENILEESFLKKMRKKGGATLKRALSKLLGLFDVRAGLVFIDRSVIKVKQTFLKLHESGHAYLPWQRKVYSIVEDCEKTLDPDVADQFDREANIFAAEVLFQIDSFIKEAEDHTFGIRTPLKICKKYGASVYASIRQYVSKNSRSCTVLVLNPPTMIEGDGCQASTRRAISSALFLETFGVLEWPEYFTSGDSIGQMIPIGGRKMSGPREIALNDRNGDSRECLAESFNNSYYVFILIQEKKKLSRKSVIVPPFHFGKLRSRMNC